MSKHKEADDNQNQIKHIVDYYVARWYYFVLGLIISLVGGYLLLRYSTPQYLTQSTVIIKDDKSATGAELAAFGDLSGLLRRFRDNKMDNELAIFKSRRIIKEVINSLNLNVTYELVGAIKGTELYSQKPFTVQYLKIDQDVAAMNGVPVLTFEVLNNEEFSMEAYGTTNTYAFGASIELPFGEITVIPSLDTPEVLASAVGKTIAVRYTNIEGLALSYQGKLNAIHENPTSNVVAISIKSPVAYKSEDFINELIFQYNKDAINDRSQIAKQTSDFIDSRLEIITRELDSVETDKETFKSQNRLTDIEAEAQIILQNASEFEKRQFDVNTQLELANSMIEYMEESSANDLLPANIGLEGVEISESVNNYNQLILQRNRLLKTSTAKNPVVVNINNQLEGIRASILSSLTNTTNSLKIALRDLNYKESIINSKLTEVPSKEKIFRGIERQQTIKEQLYLFLLQQREQASITLAVTAPKAKVVDSAFTSKSPVSPNKPVVYILAFIFGILLPFLILYVFSLLDNKIKDRNDVEAVLGDISLIGEIPKIKKNVEQTIEVNDRSVLAESFRILRTNLQYLFINKLRKGEDQSNIVFVTSTVKGEGKTFVAFNLALTFALTGKKVALVGADIRNPQLQRYLPDDQGNRKGLTEYIIDPEITIDQLAGQSIYNNHLDIILSGQIPPNPAELLMQPRTEHFFKEIRKKYDYVIVDTAPSMLVTDTIIINKLADITLYVIRGGYTEKKLLEFPRDAIQDGRLVNVASVINNVSMSNFGYGNKYGYSYSSEKISWWKRTFMRS